MPLGLVPARPAEHRLPFLVRVVLRGAAIGAAIGTIVAGLLIVTDAAGLGTLIAASSEPVVPVIMLAAGFATLIGGLCAGSAIMLLPSGE